ncbi:MAG: sigma-70 family RNA polymerase sigma factor [Bauldia sp.]
MTGEPTDFAALMAAAQDGDRAAYRRLLDAILPILRRAVARRSAAIAAADREDIVQDILMAIHAGRASYNPARPFLPWLLAIANNRLADHQRRTYRRARREVAAEDHPETFELAAANSDMAAYDDRPALRDAIAGLPAGQRTAVRLLKLEELSLKEASEISGASVPSLKIAMHRALKSLRRKLTGDA